MTTGRFSTREELIAWIWQAWTSTPACIADIARQCRVSPGVVSKILDKGKPCLDTNTVAWGEKFTEPPKSVGAKGTSISTSTP